MAQSYRTSEGDRIDLIVLKHYHDRAMLGVVIAANPHLAKIPLSLEAGVEIVLPDMQILSESKEELQAGDELW